MTDHSYFTYQSQVQEPAELVFPTGKLQKSQIKCACDFSSKPEGKEGMLQHSSVFLLEGQSISSLFHHLHTELQLQVPEENSLECSRDEGKSHSCVAEVVIHISAGAGPSWQFVCGSLQALSDVWDQDAASFLRVGLWDHQWCGWDLLSRLQICSPLCGIV